MPPNVELTGATLQVTHAGPQRMFHVAAARRSCAAVVCPGERDMRHRRVRISEPCFSIAGAR